MAINVTIGNSTADTATNLVNALNASSDSSINVATYAINANDSSKMDITYDTTSKEGNKFTLAMTSSSGAKIGISGGHLTGGGPAKFHAMEFIKDDDKYHLVGYNKDTGEIVAEEDFYGDRNERVLGYVSKGSVVDIINHNKELHIGTGNTSSDRTAWVGKLTYGKFGGDIPEHLVMEDAECKDPEGIGFFHKVVSDGTYLYAHTNGGNVIYKIDGSDGSFEKISPVGTYDRIRSIDYHDSKLWVLDTGYSEYGTVFLVDTTELTPSRECSFEDTFNGWSPKDICATNSRLWISTGSKLYNMVIPTESGFFNAMDRTPTVKQEHWRVIEKVQNPNDANSVSYNIYDSLPEFNIKQTISCPYDLSLSRMGNETDHVLWLADYGRKEEEKTFYGTHTVKGFWYGDTASLTEWATGRGLKSKKCINVVPETYDRDSRIKIYDLNHHGNESFNEINSVFQDGSSFILVSGPDIWRRSTALTSTVSGNAYIVQTGTLADIGNFTVDTETASGRITSNNDSNNYAGFTLDKGASVININKSNSSQTNIIADGVMSITVTNVSGDGNFPDGKIHRWAYTFTYDGFQESPMCETVAKVEDASGTTSDKDLLFKTDSEQRIPNRVTHLNLYRASSVGTEDDTGFFRLVKSVPINSPAWNTNASGEVSTTIRDRYKSFGSYEHRTGISEVMRNTHVHYSLGTSINNVLIVGSCHHVEIDDAENYLFKSKPFRYDIFDWSADFLKLPVSPNALTSFNGKVYSFSDNKTIRINPDSFIIEDVFDGGGTINSNSVIITEYGMFFADNSNIYQHDGRLPKPIGDPILRSDSNSLGWQDGANSDVVLSFDSKRNSLLVFFTRDDTGYCWAYNLLRNRWDLLDAPKTNSAVIGKDGEIYLSTNEGIYEYMGGSTQRLWEWQSKSITLNADSQDKMFYKLRGVGDSHTVQYKVYQNGSWSSSWKDLTSEKIDSDDKKAKAIKIKVTPNSSTDEIDSLGIIYRMLPVR